MNYHEFISQELHKRGWTKTQLIENTKSEDGSSIYLMQLSRIEKNPEKRPPANVLNKLAKAFNIDVSDIVTRCDNKNSSVLCSDPHITVTEQANPGLSALYSNELIELSKEINEANPTQPILTYESIANALVDIDTFRHPAAKRFAGTASQWASIMRKIPQSSKVFFKTSNNTIQIVGDSSVVFCTVADAASWFLGTSIIDERINVSNNVDPRFPPKEEDLCCYILNLGTKEDFVGEGNIIVLEFLKQIHLFAHDLDITRVFANVYTSDLSFYKLMGFVENQEAYTPTTSNTEADDAAYETPTTYFRDGFEDDMFGFNISKDVQSELNALCELLKRKKQEKM